MDGRGALRCSALLLVAMAGCQHQVMTVANPGPPPSGDKTPPIDRSQIKPASAMSKALPTQVWVAAGDFKAGEAAAASPPDRQQQIRELARADYEQALKIDRKCVPAYQGLARLFMSTRDTPLAIETYQKALQIAANNAQLWYELGMCHNAEKNWEPALSCLSRAELIDPRNRSYASAKAIVLAECGRYDESLSCFIHTSGEALGRYRLAQTLERLRQPELSRRYLETALQIDPSLAAALALNSDGNGAANAAAAPIQQTAYQAASQTPNAAAAPQAPPPDVPTAENAPATQQVTPTAENAPAPQSVIPPPPPVNVQYEQPQ